LILRLLELLVLLAAIAEYQELIGESIPVACATFFEVEVPCEITIGVINLYLPTLQNAAKRNRVLEPWDVKPSFVKQPAFCVSPDI
jgi:hypothetical protein